MPNLVIHPLIMDVSLLHRLSAYLRFRHNSSTWSILGPYCSICMAISAPNLSSYCPLPGDVSRPSWEAGLGPYCSLSPMGNFGSKTCAWLASFITLVSTYLCVSGTRGPYVFPVVVRRFLSCHGC